MRHSLIIAGDFLPAAVNYGSFESGRLDTIFGRKILDLFLESEYSVINLEGALTDSDIRQKKIGPAISAPVSIVKGLLTMGVKAVALANNHVTDYLSRGVQDTVDALSSVGIETVGVGTSTTMKKSLSLQICGKKLCIYNVSESFYNRPSDEVWGANIYDEYVVCNDIRELKKTHDYLVIIYHGGAEYLQYATPMMKTRFRRMVDCGADLITAQHTHCMGCEEYYNGAYLLYGQGNFFLPHQTQRMDITPYGIVLELDFSNGTVNVIKHMVRMENARLHYVDAPDFGAFEERGTHLNDDAYLVAAYQRVIFQECPRMYARNYLASAKGLYPFRQIIRNVFPKRYFPFLKKSFTRRQIEQLYRPTVSDRARENYEMLWKYMISIHDDERDKSY